MGHAIGINNLGCCDQDGIGGRKYEPKFFVNYQKPVDISHTGAMQGLEHCYQDNISMTKDKDEVMIYYKNKDYFSTIYSFGRYYEKEISVERNGISVKVDQHTALNYYQKYAVDKSKAFEQYLKNINSVWNRTDRSETCC